MVDGFQNGSSFVSVWSPVVTDVEMNADLQSYLLRTNDNLLLGAFAVGDDDSVVLRHTIVGETVDKREIEASTYLVLSTADEYDDEIINRFGGLSNRDRAQLAQQGGSGDRAAPDSEPWP